MGMETPTGHLIFFIASVTVAAMVAGSLNLISQSFVASLEDRGARASEALDSEVSILNDPHYMPYNNTTRVLTIYLKNTGELTLDPSRTEVYLNGTFTAVNSTTVLGGEELWQPGRTLEVRTTVYLPTGDHSLKVVVHYGASDTLAFRLAEG